MPDLTQEYLRSIIFYDPDSGEFTWIAPRKKIVVGSRAGHLCGVTGYWFIKVDQRKCQAHRLAWLYMIGILPSNEIDHRNLNRADNRWENLRLASSSLNKGNTERRPHNTSGFKGVTARHQTGRWVAQMTQRGRHIYLGDFDLPEDAARAYDAAAIAYFGEFARTNFPVVP